jgi:hypothetical protein
MSRSFRSIIALMIMFLSFIIRVIVMIRTFEQTLHMSSSRTTFNSNKINTKLIKIIIKTNDYQKYYY